MPSLTHYRKQALKGWQFLQFLDYLKVVKFTFEQVNIIQFNYIIWQLFDVLVDPQPVKNYLLKS